MKDLVLGDSLDALIDHRGKTPKKLGSQFTTSGVPVASAIFVSHGRLDLKDARFVSDEIFRKWMPIPVRKGDVLLTSEAPLGRVALVPSDAPLVLGQRLFALRGKPGVLDSRYLFYALQTDKVRADLIGRSTGTTVFGIRQSALRHVRISAPEYTQQRAIAEVLGAFDEKIAVNARNSSMLSRLAILLLADQPQTVPLSQVVKHRKRSLNPQNFTGDRVAHFSIPAFDTDCRPELAAPSTIKSSKFAIDQPSVLVSKLNPRFPRLWDVQKLPEQLAVASTEFLVLESKYSTSSALWTILSQPSFSASLEAKVSGTSGSHQRVRPHDLLATPVIDPRELSAEVQEQLASLGKCIALRNDESATIAATRDALLPPLMSGKIRVKDAEKTVEEVL